MKHKSWVVDDNVGGFIIQTTNFIPKNVICEAPIDQLTGLLERKEWLQIENVEVEQGVFQKQATVNEALKAQIISNEESIILAQKEAKKTKQTEYKAFKKRLKAYSKSDLTNAENIKNVIMDILTALIIIEKELWDLNENE